MQPVDGVAANPDETWCLADASRERLLLYSLAGSSIALQQGLPQPAYKGLWFDPRTGNTRELEAPVAGRAGSAIPKPSAEPWLILLEAAR